MVRLPDSPFDWSEHVHKTGRLFLSNSQTNDTVWVWSKWNINGRLFVRHAVNPDHRIWVDEMDLSLRLQSGNASKEEVARYVAGDLPPVTNSSHFPPKDNSNGDNNQHHNHNQNQHHHQSSRFHQDQYQSSHQQHQQRQQQQQYQHHNHQYNHDFPQAHHHHHSHQQPPMAPPPPPPQQPPAHLSSSPPTSSLSYQQQRQQLQRPPSPFANSVPSTSRFADRPAAMTNDHSDRQPHHAYLRSQNPYRRRDAPASAPFHNPDLNTDALRNAPPLHPVKNEYSNNTKKYSYDDGHHHHNDVNDTYGKSSSSPPSDQTPSFIPLSSDDNNNDINNKNGNKSNNHSKRSQKLKKRQKDHLEYDLDNHGNGRYWQPAEDVHRDRKIPRVDAPHASKMTSRFAALSTDTNSNSPLVRHAPSPPSTDLEQVIRLYQKFRPTSRAAARLRTAALCVDSHRVAMIHARDFRGGSTAAVQGSGGGGSGFAFDANGEEEYAFEPVIGTCEDLEKEYLRLTSAPKPSAVRPPRVLRESLIHIKTMFSEERQNYDWICRQLKSVRQDYKVQHVEDEDVLDVYQTHARIALENSDLGEFNTCVAQAQELHKKVPCDEVVRDEFAAYRILYNILVRAQEWEQDKMLAAFSVAERNLPATRFALDVRQAVVTDNYHGYFRLCRDPPSHTMVSYILVHLHRRVRYHAVRAMVAAYGPGQPGRVPVQFVFRELSFNAATAADASERPVMAKQAVGKTNSGLLKSLRELGLVREPAWVFQAVAYLLDINAKLDSDMAISPILDGMVLDCKASKAAGLNEPTSGSKLITHAGS